MYITQEISFVMFPEILKFTSNTCMEIYGDSNPSIDVYLRSRGKSQGIGEHTLFRHYIQISISFHSSF